MVGLVLVPMGTRAWIDFLSIYAYIFIYPQGITRVVNCGAAHGCANAFVHEPHMRYTTFDSDDCGACRLVLGRCVGGMAWWWPGFHRCQLSVTPSNLTHPKNHMK